MFEIIKINIFFRPGRSHVRNWRKLVLSLKILVLLKRIFDLHISKQNEKHPYTYENRNLYLWARLDTCVDVNIMPASAYKLVFRDPNLDKLVPNRLQIGTYTNDTVNIVDTCKLYLVHLDTKKLLETTFYVATNDGSMLLSCNSTLALGLIQPRSRVDYLPPRASLITSAQDHPKRTKPVPLSVHRSQQVAIQSKQQVVSAQTRVTPATKKQPVSKLVTSK